MKYTYENVTNIFNKIVLFCKVNGKFEYTNLECNILEEYGKFDTCMLKSVNRTHKYATVKLIAAKLLNNIKTNMRFLKRLNGYKPFLYNFTVDTCQFLRNPKGRNKVSDFFFGLIGPYSNLNHSCPLKDILVDKVPISFLSHQLSKVLPVPNGQYKIETYWLIDGAHVADVFISFRLF
ncbi:hypothetical protein KR093_007216 [Drosophila rubida]|uniref:Uncharacterized protein n=1 Tax=Drosophila rubida TaxID=30044 RepID=A0AAD4K0P0_9MUSC|nr:hypothetical protein KR093_007216 [Drosophila rubida]